MLKSTQKESADLLANRIAFRTNRKEEKTSNFLMKIQSSITNFDLIEIKYCSLNNVQTIRTIEPFALYSTQENWLLIAFCRLRNEFRVFRIDLIQQLIAKDECFEPHEMTLREFFDNYYSNK